MKKNPYYVLCLFVILVFPCSAFGEFIQPQIEKAQPGETVTYTVHLDTGQYDYDPVNWAPSGGSITSLGTSAIWTAPSQAGTYDIKASGWKWPKGGKGEDPGGKIYWEAHATGKSIKPIIADLTAKQTNLVADGKQISTITARVIWDGKPKSGITVNFSLLNNLGSLDKTSAVTDANGKAEVIFTVGKKPGTEIITAKVGESSKNVNIVIEPKLERTTIEGPNYVLQGQSVKYTAKAYDINNNEWSYGNLSYTWSVDGAVIETPIPPSELTTAFNTIGNHTINIIVTYKTQSKSYDKKITVFNVEVINVDATVPTVAKVNYRVNPSTVVLQSATFTAPGKTETKNNISGNFYFTFNQDDLIVGEQIIKLVGTADGSFYTVDFIGKKIFTSTDWASEIVATFFLAEGVGARLYNHFLLESYYQVSYTVSFFGKTIKVGISWAQLNVKKDTILWGENHEYRFEGGSIGNQLMSPSSPTDGVMNMTSSNSFWPIMAGLEGIATTVSLTYLDTTTDPILMVPALFIINPEINRSIP